MWFRIQDPLRNQVNLGEKCAAYGHSWSVRINSVSDGIIGNPEKLKFLKHGISKQNKIFWAKRYDDRETFSFSS